LKSNKMETINVNKETKDKFEEARFKFRLKEKRNVFQDEFVTILLNKFIQEEGIN